MKCGICLVVGIYVEIWTCGLLALWSARHGGTMTIFGRAIELSLP